MLERFLMCISLYFCPILLSLASSERKGPSSTDSNSQDTDMDEFRPVAMITRRVAEDGVEVVKSSMANLKFSQEAQNTGMCLKYHW